MRAALRTLLLGVLLTAVFAPSAWASNERPNGSVLAHCRSITFNFKGFPNANNNVVTEIVAIDGTIVYTGTFTFNGPTGSNTIPISVPGGSHKVDGHAKWNTNGFKSSYDIATKVICGSNPGFSIEKLQRLAGQEPFTYTTSTLPAGKPGLKVEYEIVVKNTGGEPLSFSNFTDPHCDGGTITGGPGVGEVLPGGTTIYKCTHLLTSEDQTAGFYTNTATVTGTPPEEDPPITHTSNTVVVELPTPTGNAGAGCGGVVFSFSGFPNVNGNTVTEFVYVNGVLVYKGTFTFNGPSGTNTIPLELGGGTYKIDGHAKWTVHGIRGSFDNAHRVQCVPEPGFTIVKKQKIDGFPEEFSTAFTTAEEGNTVDYEVIVTNTGNTPLTFSNFTDANCDGGTITGGPAGTLAAGESAAYFCTRLLPPGTGIYHNSATDTATPPLGDGGPIIKTSNTVTVEVPNLH